MKKFLAIILLFLPITADAQQVIAPPTTAWFLEWDAPTSGGPVTTYQVRYSASSAFSTIGIPSGLRIALPSLTDGGYMGEVRGCNGTPSDTTCGPSSTLGFTVQTAVPPVVPPGPLSPLRLKTGTVTVGLSCAPTTQTAVIGQVVSLTSNGGTGNYLWSATGGTPANGTAATFSTSYATAGDKTVTVQRGTGSAACKVTVTPPSNAALIFSNGWENRTELGCSWSGIVDALYDATHTPPHTATNWDDFGGAGACGVTPPEAEIDTVVKHDGGRSLRIAQRTGEQNGTDIRVLKTFGAQSEVTLIGYVRFAENYEWAPADHKNFIFTDAAGAAQNVYVNHRGQANDSLHARWALYATAPDGMVSDKTNLITRGIWYRVRVHVKSGTHGLMEMWVTPEGGSEVKLVMTAEAGNTINPLDVNTGEIGGFKLDTTYNAGNFITGIWYRWFDSISLYSGLAN